ncbi:MAG: hypothetical protein FD174_1922 [Geobacteraceae bacterium]|nr:MAG: hypothetical protein FD174_1922 [Geobacteraceae bacterium]
MTEADGKCICCEGKSGKACPVCGERELPGYWCEVCGQAVSEKRCPLCGLKARKMRGKAGEGKARECGRCGRPPVESE